MSNWRIPLSDLDFGTEEMTAVQRVVQSKWLSMGSEVKAFEEEFAQMQGAKHALAVSNATAGLHLSLVALNIGPGDEIIQPALNFVATANMTVACGAVPVFADIVGLSEPTIDPGHVEKLITNNTKAVVVMHYGGNLCRMAEFLELCKQRNILLIEDACHAVGARYHHLHERAPHGLMAGSIGDVSAFSFFANKNLAVGEGGMMVTNRDDVAERVRLLRSHGMTSLTWDRHTGHASSYDVVANGYNYRLDELHAALGRAQLAELKRNNERRRHLLNLYVNSFGSQNGWTIPFADSVANTSGHLMVAVAPTSEIRDKAVQRLREMGIQTSMHYPCIPDFGAFTQWQNDESSLTRQFVSRALTLPLFPTMTADQVLEVALIIRDAG